MVGKFGSIFAYAQDCWALMLAPVMAVFVLALFWKRMSRTAAIAVLFSSFPMLLIVFLRELFGILADFNIFNLSAIVFLISLAVGAGLSLLTQDPAPPAPDTLWRPELLRAPESERGPGFPLRKRVGFWYSLLVVCFVVIYAVFW
jgi:Na+/proline symporter